MFIYWYRHKSLIYSCFIPLHLYSEEGFLEERRGKGSTGRPSIQDLSAEKKLEKAEARIKYLKAENELLKKLEEIERQAKKRN